MRNLRIILVISFLIFVLIGCAGVQTDEEWARLEADVRARTGKEILWKKSAGDEAAAGQQVEKLLLGGLSRQEAIRIALLNNRELQGALEEIGISKSDLVQAGLFHNPSLSAFFRFPFDGGRTNIESDGLLVISDLWQIPFRKKVARSRLEATMKRVEQTVLETTREAKKAYDSAYYLSLTRRETDALLSEFKEIRAEVKRRRDFGFMTELDIHLARIMETEALMAFHRIESELSMAKAHLDRILGFGRVEPAYELSEDRGETPPSIPDIEVATKTALEHRLDIQMAKAQITEAQRRLELERTRFIREVRLGASYEREVDGEEVLGPGIELELPLFDQNQAQIAKAEFRVRRARKRVQALEGQVFEEISHDLYRIRLHETRMRLFREQIFPLREKALAYANKWVQAMQLNRLYLLEAQKGLLENQLDYLKTRIEFYHAIADLEFHMGGDLPRASDN